MPPARPAASAPATRAKATKIAAQLAGLYPAPACPLDHGSRFQLLVAVMLSAQTTDLKVNECTPALFSAAPDASAMAALGPAGIEPHIRTLGLAPTKARNVAGTAAILAEQHGGDVPLGWEALMALPGVGRKTASVVRAMAGADDAFAVDTHIHRLAARWGISAPGSSVDQTEADLKAAFAGQRHDWAALHVRIILFGREHCPARGHEARGCPICSWAGSGGRG